jgi:hypothetical protein
MDETYMCATKRKDEMSGKPHDLYRQAMSRWGVASERGCSEVKELALKGTGAVRSRAPKGPAWLRGHMVSPNEADFNLRETHPLPRDILLKGI